MGKYKALLRSSAARELSDLAGKDLRLFVAKIRGLENSPRPPGCRKLAAADKYRLRQGDLRIVYSIDDDERIVIVVKIGHRKDVCR